MLLFTINTAIEYIYCEARGKMCKVLRKVSWRPDAVGSGETAAVFTNKVIEDNNFGHLCCEKFELELHKVTSELKSAKEIIEILKEELGITDRW
jgi:hypothetical protein